MTWHSPRGAVVRLLAAAAIGTTAPANDLTDAEMRAMAQSVGLGTPWHIDAYPVPHQKEHWALAWLGDPREIAGGMCRFREVDFDVVRTPSGLSAMLSAETSHGDHFQFSAEPCARAEHDNLFSVDKGISDSDLVWAVRTSLAIARGDTPKGVTVSHVDEEVRSLVPALRSLQPVEVTQTRGGNGTTVEFIVNAMFVGIECTRQPDGSTVAAIVYEGDIDVVAVPQ